MTGAVAVGMFARPDVAVTILAAHYLSSLSLGLLLRFYRPRSEPTPPLRSAGGGRSVVARAWNAMHEARRIDGRSFAKLLGDAVRRSVDTLLLVGGFIILFAVVVRTLEVVGLVAWMSAGLGRLLAAVGLDRAVAPALVSGAFEITIGTEAASQAAAPLLSRLVAASAVIAWSGLSVHAQVASVTQGTKMGMGPYMAARLGHAVLAGAYTVLLWRPVAALTRRWAVPAFWQASPLTLGAGIWRHRLVLWGSATGVLLLGLAMLFLFLLAVRGVRFVFIEGERPPRRRS
jgi:sporulation integral membrane protein YlbJ